MATTSNWESFLSPQEVRAYAQFFSAANGGKSNAVHGREAVQFFVRSGIPNEILSDIWETADRDNLGYLTPETFSIALKLIACAQHGHDVSQPILSTVVPLPQFEGFNPDLSPISPNATGPVDTVASSEREKYLTIFRAHQPVQGLLDGAKAREIFLKSKLPKDILEQIWNLANVRKSGNLNQTEFVIAMHYIARMMDQTLPGLPSQLPASVYGSAAGSISSSPVIRRTSISPISRQTTGGSTVSHMAPLPPPSRVNKVNTLSGVHSPVIRVGPVGFGSNNTSNWGISLQQRQQFDAMFDRLDPHHTGLLPGAEAGKFFKNSRLPEAELARVWDLVDTEQRGQLTRDEFAVAMFLIQKRFNGEQLPNTLPASLAPNPHQQPAAGILGRSPFFQSPPSLGTPSPPTQPLVAQEPLGDLLGDFDNGEQLTEATNGVNQLQYQIKNETSALNQAKAQKQEVDQQLKGLREQKEDFILQTKHLLELVEAEKKRLSELQSAVSKEEPEWSTVRQEHTAAQSRIDRLKEEITKAKTTLDERKSETERLRREVHIVQKQRDSYADQLDRLRGYVKQQEKQVSFDDVFGTPTFEPPQLVQIPPTQSQDSLVNEFDTLFGPSFDEPKRQAPPPPPPHRRSTVRRPDASPSSIAPTTPSPPVVIAPKKQRAPPPPPPIAPTTTTTTTAATPATAEAVAVSIGAAAVAAVIPQAQEFKSESESEEEADTTTTEDDSEDEIPLSDLRSGAPESEPSASGRDIRLEDTIPLASSPKVDLFGADVRSNDEFDLLESTTTAAEGLHPTAPESTGPGMLTSQDAIRDTGDSAEFAVSDTKPGDVYGEGPVETEPKVDDVFPAMTESAESEDNKMDINEKPVVSQSSSEDVTLVVREVTPEEESQVEDITAEEPTGIDENAGIDDLSINTSQPAAVGISDPVTEANINEEPIADDTSPQIMEAQQPGDVEEVEDAILLEQATADKAEPVMDTTPGVVEQITSDNEIGIDVANSTPTRTETTPEATLPISVEEKPIAESEQVTKDPEPMDSALPENKTEVDPAENRAMEIPGSAQEPRAANQEESSSSAEEEVKAENPKDSKDIGEPDAKEVGTAALATSAAIAAVIHDIDREDHKPEDPVTEVEETDEKASAAQCPSDEKPKIQESIDEDRRADEYKTDDLEPEEIAVPDTRSLSSDTPPTNEEEKAPEAATQSPPQPVKATTPNTSEEEDDFQSVVSDGVIDMDENTLGSPEQRPSPPIDLTASQEETGKSPEPLGPSGASPLEPSLQQTTNPFDATTTADDPFDVQFSEDEVVAANQATKSFVDDKELQNDFDAVFMERPGDKANMGSSSSDWTTGENESFEMVSSNASLEKHKQAEVDEDEFDGAFESELQDATVVEKAPGAQQPSFDDDFDAAFSSDLMDAKIIRDNNSNPFGHTVEENTESSKGKTKLTWASSFGGFDFGQDEDDEKTSDEWDTIFGGGAATNLSTSTGVPAAAAAAAATEEGFEDSFDSSKVAEPEAEQQEPEQMLGPAHAHADAVESPAVPEPGPAMFVGGDNVDQLVAMGFERALAKDALNRYDQDLEKATNFLLDN